MSARPVLLATALLATATAGAAQSDGRAGGRFVPFGVGERAEYRVSLGIFGDVGTGHMEVVGLETVDGHRTYHLQFDLRGKVLLGSVDTRLESWMDTNGLFTRRIHKDQDEVNYEADKWYDVWPERKLYQRRSSGAIDTLPTSRPQDEVSFMYYVRTLPLEVGRTYTLNDYYRRSGNPVTIHVVRRDTLRGTGGTDVPVVVIRPVIKTSGLFGEGGEAELYFTDDWRRILVKMTSKVPIIGRLGLTLTKYTPGRRLDDAGR
jgi:hypothetical protein